MFYDLPKWVIGACVFAGFAVIGYWFSVLFTGVYQHILYPRRLKKRYASSFLPCCSVIIPCKGIHRNSARGLGAFFRLDYPDYNVIFTVESESDSIVPLIREFIAQDARASLVVAGLASKCAQKNHNLLAAIRQANDAEVLVFADSDIESSPQWLRELVLPLSDPGVTIASSFHWPHARKNSLGEFAFTYINIFTYVVFVTAAFWGGIGLWGGSMAIRKRDFEALGVAERWAETVVDDISLSQIALRNRLKLVAVLPAPMTYAGDLLQTFGESITWYTRQALYLKAYHRRIWMTILPVVVGVVLVYMLLPLAIAGAAFTPASFWKWGGGAPLILFGGEMVAALLYAWLGPTRSLFRFMLLTPVLQLAPIASYFKTVGTMTMVWSGVRYTFDSSGKVTRVER